jgi:pimeloyl-ACP methyl ester carboxylesterase
MEKRFITLKNGMKIFALQKGTENLPPLILLHGWPSNTYLWRNILPGLSKNFSVYVPDLPGHGRSDKPLDVDYDMAFFHDFLIDFYDALGLEKASLVAHDLGAIAGLSLAVRNPQKIEKLVIMNTGPYSNWPLTVRLLLNILSSRPLTSFFLNRFVYTMLLKSSVANAGCITPEVVDLYRNHWIDTTNGKEAFSRTIKAPPSLMAEPVEKLRAIDIETMILWGKEDKFFPFSLARKLHRDIRGSKLVGIEKAGHFIQEDNPKYVQEKILDFLVEKPDVSSTI